MDNAKRGLLELLRQFETQFKEAKQEYKDNFHLDAKLKRLSIPAKYKGKIQRLLDDQENELSGRRMFAFKCALNRIMITFANYNEEVNGFAGEVARILMNNIWYNAEDNVANQLMDMEEEVGHGPEELANLQVKVEEMDQDSTEVVLSTEASGDDSQLQPSASSHSNEGAMINELPQLVTPVLEQNTNNRPLVIEPPVHISKKDMWKKLPLEPETCLVKDCGTKFDYRGFRQDHIEKDHQNTELACPLCPEHFTTYTTLDRHYQKKHAFSYQCTFHNCAFTSKTKRQVTKHFEERHMVSAIVNNHEDKSTNQDSDDGDDDLSKDEVNSEENANVRPINQGSMATVPSPVASGSDDSNDLPVQQPSTSAEPKTTKRTCVQTRGNEECNQVYVDGLAQSSASVKKAKLNVTRSDNAQVTSQSEPKAKCNPTKEGRQVLNRNDMAIFLGLECFQLNCELMFDTKEQLNHHMWVKHQIREFPCLAKHCDKSFNYGSNLFVHYKNDHKNTTEWGCAKCSGHYDSQHDLFYHYVSHHTSKYKCTFASCTFTSNQIVTTCRHYVNKHMISCGEYDCVNKANAYEFNFYSYSNGLKHYHYK